MRRDETMRFSDGVELALTRWEAPSARAIVCGVHGLGEHALRYEKVAAAWNRHGCSMRMLDLRGHGRSPGKRGYAPYARTLQDILELLTAAAEEGPPLLLFGHSLGGGIALRLMVTQPLPIAGGIVTSPWLRLVHPIRGPRLAFLSAMRRLAPSATISNGLAASGLCHDEAVCRAYEADPLVHDRVSMDLAWGAQKAGELSIAAADRLDAPLLLMHGGDDPICDVAGSRALAERAGGGCAYHEYPGMYHELHNEAVWPDVFAREAAFADGVIADAR